jgi:hypothetical protein
LLLLEFGGSVVSKGGGRSGPEQCVILRSSSGIREDVVRVGYRLLDFVNNATRSDDATHKLLGRSPLVLLSSIARQTIGMSP